VTSAITKIAINTMKPSLPTCQCLSAFCLTHSWICGCPSWAVAYNANTGYWSYVGGILMVKFTPDVILETNLQSPSPF